MFSFTVTFHKFCKKYQNSRRVLLNEMPQFLEFYDSRSILKWSASFSFFFFTNAPILCTQSDMLGFYFILFASITVTWTSLFDADRFKLETKDFCLPCCNVLKKKFPNFGEEILASHSAKGFWGSCSLFCFLFSCGICLFNICLKRSQDECIYFLFFCSQGAHNCSN